MRYVGAFLIALGLNQSNRPSDAVGQWKRLKKIVLKGTTEEKNQALSTPSIKKDVEDIVTAKRSKVYSWLVDMGNFYSDTIPAGALHSYITSIYY